MRQLFVLLLIPIIVGAKAQVISGIVVDEKNEAVAYASISLLQANDSSFVTGTSTDSEGRFSLESDAHNKLLKVSYVGYTTLFLQPSQDMLIVLNEGGLTIGNVVITGNRPTYKMRDGSLVAPVSNTVLGKLGDANDVLAQLPMVSKNSEGYQVIGRGKPLIYINNRLIRDEKELDEIKSNEIKDIKIDLTPGSQYSAEVGAVIKITINRPVGEGFGGQILSYFKCNARNSFREQVDLNFRHQELDLFIKGSWGSNSVKQSQSDMTSFDYKSMPISVSQSGTIITTTDRLTLTSGFNYNFNENQIIGVRYHYGNVINISGDGNFNGTYTGGENKWVFSTCQSISTPTFKTQQADAFYQNEISDKWQINLDASYLTDKAIVTERQKESREGAPFEVNNQSESMSRLWALKAWSTNKWLNGTAEWGIELTDTRYEQSYLMLNEDVAQYIPSTENRSKQKAQSLFLSYSHPFGFFNASIGLRFEHIDYDYEVNKQHDDEVSRSYCNLFPSFSLSYNKEKTNLSLSFRTMVNRPSYEDLSSRIQYNNSYSVQGGNPQLQSCYQHSLTFVARHHNWVLDAAYNYYQDAIMVDYYVLDDYPMMMSTIQNHDMHSWHVNLIWSPIIGFWKPSLMAGFSGQTLQLYGESYNGNGFDYQWKNLLTLPKNWIINVNVTGNSARTQYLNRWPSNFEVELSFRKDIGPWQFTVGGYDIFNTSRESFLRDVNGVIFDKHNNFNQQGFYLRAVYSFNPVKSKYIGGKAGQSERSRL